MNRLASQTVLALITGLILGFQLGTLGSGVAHSVQTAAAVDRTPAQTPITGATAHSDAPTAHSDAPTSPVSLKP